MRLLELIDFADMLGRMRELEGDTLAMPAGWKAPALDHGDLVRHVGVLRVVRDCVGLPRRTAMAEEYKPGEIVPQSGIWRG
jgi:hypothetical protein